MDKNGYPVTQFEKRILLVGGIILSFYLLSKILFVIKPFVIAFLIGIAFHPALSWLEKRGVRRFLSLILGVLGLTALVGIGGYFIVPILVKEAAGLLSDLPRLWGEMGRRLNFLHHWLPGLIPPIQEADLTTKILQNLGKFFPLLRQFASSLFSLGATTLLVLFTLVFGLHNPTHLKNCLLEAIPPRHREKATKIGRRILGQLKSWVQGLLLAMAFIGLLSFLGLLILRVKYAFAFGILAGILEIVPYVGPILSALLPAALTALDDPTKGIYVIILFFFIQQIENNILIPLIMSRQLTLHPLGVIFFFLVMTYYFGFFGTFVAIPTYACAAILYEELYLGFIGDRGSPETTL